MLRRGGPDRRFDRPLERIAGVLQYVGLHTRMFRNVYSGLLHVFIFYGFVVLLTAILDALIQGIFPGHDLGLIGGHGWLAFLQDLFGVLVLLGVAMALVNRLLIRPRQFQESNEVDALIILGLIATIMIGMLEQFATSTARGGDPAAGARPFSSALATLFEAAGWSATSAALPHEC